MPLSRWQDHGSTARARGHRQGGPGGPRPPFMAPGWIGRLGAQRETTHPCRNRGSDKPTGGFAPREVQLCWLHRVRGQKCREHGGRGNEGWEGGARLSAPGGGARALPSREATSIFRFWPKTAQM